MPETTDVGTPRGTAESAPVARQSRVWLWPSLTGIVILGLIAVVVPAIGDANELNIWTQVLMFCVLAQSWNFIGGFTGYAAFGNVAFFGIGAYSVGICLTDGRPFWLGLIVGAAAAGAFALLLGLPVLRLRGHYFAIATLGVAEALRELAAAQNVGGSGGTMALPLPDLGPRSFFFAFVGLSLACLLLTAWLSRSKFGYALIAIRDGEPAAEALGIETYRYKVAAFVLSAVPTALAGGLYAYQRTGFDPSAVLSVGFSVETVLLAFLGGAGTVLGPLVGGILFEYGSFRLLTTNFSYHNSLLGLAIIVVTIFLPRGLVGLAGEFIRRPATGTAPRNRFREGVRHVRRYIAANGV
jgi:branched-chain amino acid transport system permease protein